MRTFIAVLLLIFNLQSWTKADDISDFQIEGISIGDSALDFFSKDEIKKNKQNYYNDDKFIPSEFEYLDFFSTYDAIQITYKKNDSKFKIYGIAGFLDYPKNIKDCYKKKDEIINDLSTMFPTATIQEESSKHSGDSSGKSITTSSFIEIDNGAIEVSCDDWSKEVGYLDVLRVDISTNEFIDWVTNEADDISDFEIEGISIGDSALKYVDLETINKHFEKTKNHYTFLKEPLKFREVYIFESSSFKTYESVSFMVKGNDPNYKIFFIRGMKEFINNFDQCMAKRNDISNEIEKLFVSFKKRESKKIINRLDESGKSFRKQIIYTFDSGAEIIAGCNNWDEEIRKKNSWSEGFNLAIITKDVANWFDDSK